MNEVSAVLDKIIDFLRHGFARVDFKSFWNEFVALIKSVM